MDIKGFVINTFGLQFILQYFGEKVLDGVFFSKEDSDAVECLRLFEKTLESLCDEQGWEYDSEAVHANFQNIEINLGKIRDEEYCNECLCLLLGKNYSDNYEVDVLNEWKKNLSSCLTNQEFDKLYKMINLYFFDNINNHISDIIKQINQMDRKIQRHEEDSTKLWKEKEQLNRSSEKNEELMIALDEIEIGEYEEAISKLKKVCVWGSPEVKYTCFYEMGYCYSKLASNIDDYQKAKKFFIKAEKIMDPERDDVVLLLTNIGLIYTYVGNEINKVQNYQKANEYFEKALEYIDANDEYYIVEIILHIARNQMDICNEVEMQQAKECLNQSLSMMLGICMAYDQIPIGQAFVLLHNLGRVFFLKGEIESRNEFFQTSREFYEIVLGMDYIKDDKKRFAMVNENMALAFHADSYGNNFREALAYYTVAEKTYKNIDDYDCRRNLANIELSIAELYRVIYSRSGDITDFEQAKVRLADIIKENHHLPNNSIVIRAYLALIELYYNKANLLEDDRKVALEQADKYCSIVSTLLKRTEYDKYLCTYKIIWYKILLLKIKEDIDYGEDIDHEMIKSYIEELSEIKAYSKMSNKNIYQVAEALLSSYESIYISKDEKI